MAQTLQAAIGQFVSSLTSIGASLSHSILAVFLSILSLLQAVVSSIFHLAQSVVQLGVDVFQGVAGFAMANFFVIALLGGAYYMYTTKYGQRNAGAGKSLQKK